MSFFPSNTYDLFITHNYYYTDPWQGVVALLDEALPGRWRNWSLPWHDTSIERRSPKGRATLERTLRGQIGSAKMVLLLPETASTTDGKVWLETQLAIARELGKPVLGMRTLDGDFPDSLRDATCEVIDRSAAAVLRAADTFGNADVEPGRRDDSSSSAAIAPVSRSSPS